MLELSPPPTSPSNWIPITVAALTLIGPLSLALVTWWNESNRDARRIRVWAEAKAAIDFWEARLKLVQMALNPEDELFQFAKADTLDEISKLQTWLKYQLQSSSSLLGPNSEVDIKHSALQKLLLLHPEADLRDYSLFRLGRAFYWGALVIGVLTEPIYLFYSYSQSDRVAGFLAVYVPLVTLLNWFSTKRQYDSSRREYEATSQGAQHN